MDDIKKLIERYKKELTEMSRAAPASEKPRSPQIIGYVDTDKGVENSLNSLDKIFEQDADDYIPQNSPYVDDEIPVSDADDFRESADNFQENADGKQLPEREKRDNGQADGQIAQDNPAAQDVEPLYTEIPSFEQTREEITEESVPEDNIPAPDASGVTDNSPITPRPDFAEGGSVSFEQAEDLTRQPISGTDYDEQLTGRSFPDNRIPENSRNDITRSGSKTEPGDFPETVYTDFSDFESKNTGSGTLSFRVYTAREALPISGAVVSVSSKIADTAHDFGNFTTDESGQTLPLTLPAPQKNLSLDSGNRVQPFALYDAVVTRDGFFTIKYTGIPVFDGVNSVQSVALVPQAQPLPNVGDSIGGVENAER